MSAGGKEGGAREAGEDHGGKEERIGNDTWVNADGHVQQGTRAKSLKKQTKLYDEKRSVHVGHSTNVPCKYLALWLIDGLN